VPVPSSSRAPERGGYGRTMDFDFSWGTAGWPWAVLALVNAGLAEQKGRSRLAWFLVSLLLGPLATLLIVVWPRVDPTERPAEPTAWDLPFLLGVLGLVVTGALVIVAAAAQSWPLWVAAGVAAAATVAVATWAIVRARRRRRGAPPAP
jgi:uncharacterized integral membrane protein